MAGVGGRSASRSPASATSSSPDTWIRILRLTVRPGLCRETDYSVVSARSIRHSVTSEEVTLALPEIVSREEWLTARLRLLELEKEETRRRTAVNAERRALPMV